MTLSLRERLRLCEERCRDLSEQLSAALDREAGTADAFEDANSSASGYRADRDRIQAKLDAALKLIREIDEANPNGYWGELSVRAFLADRGPS